MDHEAETIGAGPEGLVGANALSEARLSVLLVEAKEMVVGGCHPAELSLPWVRLYVS